jgi:hypothetical protein
MNHPDLATAEERRPGITKLYEHLKLEHPSWSPERLMIESKVFYTNEKIVVKKAGQFVEVANPYYKGGNL